MIGELMNTELLQDKVDNALKLSKLMMLLGDLNLFTTIGIYKQYAPDAIAVAKGWAGEVNHKSRAPMIGRIKVLQLLTLPPRTRFALSPVIRLGLGPEFDYAGGVLQLVNKKRYVVSGSAQSALADLMFASTFMHALQEETLVHHFGTRHPSLEDALTAVSLDEERFGTKAIYLPTGIGDSEHDRWYIPCESDLSPMGIVWFEHQHFKSGKFKGKSVHWDLFTPQPTRLLSNIGRSLDEEPIVFDQAGEKDPIGMIGTDNKGVRLSIMTRGTWWSIQA